MIKLKLPRNLSSLIVYLIFAGICLSIVIASSQRFQKANQDLVRERYSRMTMEEQLDKAKNDIKQLETALINARNQVQNLQTIWEQEKLTYSNLKAEFDRTVKLKEDLEKKLMEAYAQQAQQPPEGGPQ